MKYIALLRGINVGGKNKVPMPALKTCIEALGFTNVKTYINSGNVIFDTPKTDNAKLVQQCEAAIEHAFGFRVICAVVAAHELEEALAHAPTWWDEDDLTKHNALFVIAPATPEIIMKEMGKAKPEYEKVASHGPIIFWSAPIKTFSRTRYSKIVGTASYQSITIRNANTTKKLLQLAAN